jgi:hypothetical protein
MPSEEKFDPKELAREKQASREKDAQDLSSGRVSPQEMRRRNAHFAGLRVRLRLDRAKALF